MKKLLPIIMILSLFLASCGKTEEKSDKPQVYTSFYAMYDFARTIGGEDIDLYNVVPTGTEPHDFEPTAADMAKLSKADVFIFNGMGVDEWAEKVAPTLPENVSVLRSSDGINDDGNDPHVWLSLKNAKAQLEAVSSALSEADSLNAHNYAARLAEYSEKIDNLEKEYENANLSGKKLFVTHGAYGYLCDEFGMEQVALEGISGDSDPSPAQMAKIVDEIKADGAKCIFYDPLEGDKMANAVAKEAGIEAVELYTFEGDSENRDYITIMQTNLEQLKKSM
ncbi:MAG: metal ABC transporter substrate-binding protein [Hominilimicola sp.]